MIIITVRWEIFFVKLPLEVEIGQTKVRSGIARTDRLFAESRAGGNNVNKNSSNPINDCQKVNRTK